MRDMRFQVHPLSEVAIAIKDGTHGTHRRVAKGVPLLSAKNITANGEVAWDETDDLIADSEYRELSRSFALEPGDLLLTIVGSLGRRAIFAGESVTFQRSVAYVRPQAKKLHNRFLFHWMGHPKFLAELARRSNATAQAGLYLGELAKVSVPLPERTEQTAISRVLDTLNTAIHETEAVIDKLEAVKQGLLDDLLTRGIDANGELRPPQVEAPHLYKESPLGWIPREWRSGQLESWLNGKPKNGYSPQEAPQWTGIQMLGLGCLTAGGFSPVQLKCAPANDKRLGGALLRNGDLLMSRANTRELVGQVGTYRDVGTPCTYPDLMMRLSPSSETSAAFLELVLRSGRSRAQVRANAVGTSESMVKISGTTVRKLIVSMPAKDEQEVIVGHLSVIQARLRAEAEQADGMRVVKAGLMDDLLTGRVRVTPLLENSPQ